MSDPMPELYDNAASRCIRGVIRGYLHLADQEDISFCEAICGDVIDPLFKNCKQWK